MIIRFGNLVTAASGVMGSMQFVARRTTPVVRIAPTKVKKHAKLITNRRQLFSAASRAFEGGTTAFQRAAWKTAASLYNKINVLGVSQQLTARQFFFRTNMQAWVTPGNYIVDPPDPVSFNTAPLEQFLFLPGGDWEIKFDNIAGAASHVAIFGFTLYPTNLPPRRPQVRFVKLVPADSVTYLIQDEWNAVLPPGQPTSEVWLEWYGTQQTGSTPGGRGPLIGRQFTVQP